MLVTIYADNDGYALGQSATYATARTTGTSAVEDATPIVGQTNDWMGSGQFGCLEGFLSFPFASLGDYSAGHYKVRDMDLYLKVAADGADTNFNVNVMAFDWNTALTLTDWRNGSTSLTGTTLFTVSSSGAAVDQYLTIPCVRTAAQLGSDLNTAITALDYLRLLLYSDRHKAGTSPSGSEYLSFYSAATAGTTSDPYIVVDYCDVHIADAGFLHGALGPATLWHRELSASEMRDVMQLGQVVLDRATDSGSLVIEGMVETRAGTKVEATHVRSGWWVQNLDYDPEEDDKPRPLLITGHGGTLKSGENALTIGVDWMEEEMGVKLADLLTAPGRTSAPRHGSPAAPGQIDGPATSKPWEGM